MCCVCDCDCDWDIGLESLCSSIEETVFEPPECRRGSEGAAEARLCSGAGDAILRVLKLLSVWR
jgi:hypothetical protein